MENYYLNPRYIPDSQITFYFKSFYKSKCCSRYCFTPVVSCCKTPQGVNYFSFSVCTAADFKPWLVIRPTVTRCAAPGQFVATQSNYVITGLQGTNSCTHI